MRLEASKRGYLIANSDDNVGDEFTKIMELEKENINLSL
jgi:hypothetical protein